MARKKKNTEEATWGYDNDPKSKIWKYSAFTESGAITLAKTMKRMGCEIVNKPTQREDGLWMFSFTNPFLVKK